MRSALLGVRAATLALALLVACVDATWPVGGSVSAAKAAEPDPIVGTRVNRLRARAQLHRNGLRGAAYVSTWYPDGSKEPAQLRMRPRAVIRLDGDGTTNVRGNVYPIDVNGDRKYELLHYNGHQIMRVYRQDGTKVWELKTPNWRPNRSPWHRDTVAVFDVDGDGGEDIVHCWSHGDYASKVLVARKGSTGAVIKRIPLDGTSRSEECQIAAFHVAGRSQPLLLVSGHSRKGSGCHAPWVDTWSRVTAFDAGFSRQWERETCAAGHYAWPVDENSDGVAEAFFIGKYLLKPDGTVVCTLAGWGRDHVDSLAVGDFNRGLPGHEVVAAGLSGTHLYSYRTCKEQWRIAPRGRIIDPQTVAAARLIPGHGWPSLFVTESGKQSRRHTYLVAPDGTVELSYRTGAGAEVQFQNANLDGARAVEDRVSRWGEVVAPDGKTRLGTGWYWKLQQLTANERGLKPQDEWTYTPLVFDYDGDGQDELTVWGRRLLVIGETVH